MKFIPRDQQSHGSTTRYSGNNTLENYIFNTKECLDIALPHIVKTTKKNVTKTQQQAIDTLRRKRHEITIKPADKNLGVVIMDTEDYIQQCMKILTDTDTYHLANEYPTDIIKNTLENIIAPFKQHLRMLHKKLPEYLLPSNCSTQVPKLYGLPKIHKTFKELPPMRPIVAQSGAILTPTARFIDHVLQPLARSYTDYIQNSTSLILKLENMHIPKEAILITVDVESLYPSIPQDEMLEIIYEQMHQKRHLILCDTNLIMKLLHTCVNYNYFQFANFSYQQIHGTAMGAAFSPTVANIFMSVTLQRFLNTRQQKPLILARYIDDIFIIWPNSETLPDFITALNNFHPKLRFTHEQSPNSINFLDITIYKGPNFQTTQLLDLKTYQKPQNLYQYIEYTSEHPEHIYRSIILGECTRYLRTNTREETYTAIIKLFQKRLTTRQYPQQYVKKLTSRIKFKNRKKVLQRAISRSEQIRKLPIFKCHPPPQYDRLKIIILQDYYKIYPPMPKPRFITFSHPTLRQTLIRATVKPTDEQLVNILINLEHIPEHTTHVTSGKMPKMIPSRSLIRPCKNQRCTTCQHLNCKRYFSSTVTHKRYPIRHSATCSTKNTIYLITCTKCSKQYVGMTTKQLNARIHNHRHNIYQDKTMYMCIHFNFPDHSIKNLSVQVIEVVTNSPNTKQHLQQLEQYWIRTLETLEPKGLNSSRGASISLIE